MARGRGAALPLVAALAALAVGSCGGDGGSGGAGPGGEPSPGATSPTTAPPSTPSTGAPGPGPVAPGVQRVTALAVADLADRLGVEPAAIEVVRAEPRTWSDASLGCPQPGMRYAQVPQDGVLVVLTAEGRTYRYHAGGAQTEPFLCTRRAARAPDPPPTLGLP